MFIVDNNANRKFTIVNVYIRVYFYRQSEQEKICTKAKAKVMKCFFWLGAWSTTNWGLDWGHLLIMA